ncbi:hypothetical protein J6590_021455 [Homalodisca vitripennis]|nr:hypothetical protein J6590_021455 [Homalodisca vitripennis]
MTFTTQSARVEMGERGEKACFEERTNSLLNKMYGLEPTKDHDSHQTPTADYLHLSWCDQHLSSNIQGITTHTVNG